MGSGEDRQYLGSELGLESYLMIEQVQVVYLVFSLLLIFQCIRFYGTIMLISTILCTASSCRLIHNFSHGSRICQGCSGG